MSYASHGVPGEGAAVWTAGGCRSWYIIENRRRHQPLSGRHLRLAAPDNAFRSGPAPDAQDAHAHTGTPVSTGRDSAARRNSLLPTLELTTIGHILFGGAAWSRQPCVVGYLSTVPG